MASAPQVVTGEYVGPEGTRRWRLAMPALHRSETPRPMLVMLHGCLQDAADIARGTGFDDVAASAGILVLYPEQPESANPRKCWNWFDAAHHHRGAGEPGLLAALIDRVGAEYGADATRVHLAGVSAGAAMATLLAVAYPERFQSLTSVAGVGWASARTVMEALGVMQRGADSALPSGAALVAAMGSAARRRPVLVVHGGADHVVSVRNATELTRQFVEAYDLLQSIGGDAPLSADSGSETVQGGYRVREQRWCDAAGRALVTSVRVDELGHAWPAGHAAGSFTDPSGPSLAARIGAFVADYRDVSATP